jgi:hypothetical protein
MDSNALNTLIAQWAREDAQMPPGYIAPVSALRTRLLGVKLATLQSSFRSVRADVWMERDGDRFHVGFRDNREPATYNALLSCAATVARTKGWTARLVKPRGSSSHATLTVRYHDAEKHAEAAYPLYVRLLKTERAALACRAAL